jgi:hypothetical protein
MSVFSECEVTVVHSYCQEILRYHKLYSGLHMCLLCLQIEQELGVTLLMINIDECLIEKASCESSCTNFLSKSNKPSAVYTRTTSFVGVHAVVDPMCMCTVAEPLVCLNGGTPVGTTLVVYTSVIENTAAFI